MKARTTGTVGQELVTAEAAARAAADAVLTAAVAAAPDGCGPYGRHLTGATNWQKRYGLSPQNGGGTSFATLAADTDYLIPVMPPSESLSPSALELFVVLAGTTSFVRAALYDAVGNNLASLSRVLDFGEQASDSAGTALTFASACTLPKNARYYLAVCSRGAVLPTLAATADDRSLISWLGMQNNNYNIGMVVCSRVNGAFPATYNGVYSALVARRITACGLL
jgi:hypothetical protein